MPGAARLQAAVSSRSDDGWLSTLFLGAVYGLAGFCSGPVLGAILTVAATQDSPWQGGALLAVYALGMAAPLFVLAALWDRFDLGRRRWLRGRTLSWGAVRLHTTSLLAGLLFITVGVVFLRYDGTAGLTGSLGMGDLTDLEYSAQRAVTEWTAQVPAWALPLVVVLIALVVAWRRRGARRAGRAGRARPRRHALRQAGHGSRLGAGGHVAGLDPGGVVLGGEHRRSRTASVERRAAEAAAAAGLGVPSNAGRHPGWR